jgi:hypothetical protein
MHMVFQLTGRTLVGIAFLASMLCSGCGGGGTPKPKTVKVTGKVIYKGLPVQSASVAFLGDGNSPPALGRTDAEGRFELTTSDPGDGAVPGVHKVTVAKIVASSKPSTATGTSSMEDMARKAADRGNKPPAEDAGPMSLLPDKYSQASTSDLAYEVKESGTNDFTIELKD